ncbi:CHY zinc finger protein [Ectobacillus polymachus]|uniref:CHY zinc finger protein n=1 Tax=Ectobacillus polymachus TaxID=1508806 RepID=UPI003A8A1A4A
MVNVYGFTVDNQTRCKHYATEKDIIAIKFKCCNTYYPCYKCHEECEDHPIVVWKKEEFDKLAILCGVCKTEHTIQQYMHANHCLHCGSTFNEGCRKHYHLYFEYNENQYDQV